MPELEDHAAVASRQPRWWWGASITVAVVHGLAFLFSAKPPDGTPVIEALGVAWFVAGLVMSVVVTLAFGAAIPVLVLRGDRRHRQPPWIFVSVVAVVTIQWLSRVLAP